MTDPGTLDPFVGTAAWTLAHSLWQGMLVAIVLALILGGLRGRSARTRYALACMALLIATLLPAATAVFQRSYGSPASESARIATEVATTAAPGGLIAPTMIDHGVDLRARVSWFFDRFASWIVLGWLVGASWVSVRNFRALKHVRAVARTATQPLTGAVEPMLLRLYRRMNLAKSVQVLQSSLVRVPTLIGWLRPVILIPASALTGLPLRQIEALLAHELAHVRRHDYAVNLVQVALETVFFYHPAVHWISKRVRIERELCCDDAAVEICGDRLAYARALTEMEQLRSVPTRLAIGADGPSLSHRVRRVVQAGPGPRGMTGWPGALLALGVVVSVAFVVLPESPLSLAAMRSETSISLRTDSGADFSRLDGQWKARFHGDRIRLRLEMSQPGIRWESSSTLRESELSRGPDGSYELRRDAGAFRLVGLEELSGSDSGDFLFVPDPAFADKLAALGHDRIDPETQFHLAVADIGLDLIETVARYNQEIDLGEIVSLRNHGIDEKYIRGLEDAALAGLSAGEIIRLRNHGVDAGYAKDLSEAGFGVLPVEHLVRLRNHGVDAGYLAGIAGAGYSDASVEEVIRLRNHGVPADYFEGLRAAGYGRASLDDVITLRNHGISTRYLEQLAAAGLVDLSLGDVVRLANHGVTPEFMKEAADSGFRTLSVGEVVQLRTHGVSSDFLRRLQSAGRTDLSVDEVVRLTQHGASPELFTELDAAGLEHVRPEDVVRLQSHGVAPSYIRGLHDAGIEDLSVEQLVELRSHGVGSEYVREVFAAAGRSYPSEELIRMRTRGVNGSFIRHMVREGQRDLSAENLIRLMDHGGRGRQVY